MYGTQCRGRQNLKTLFSTELGDLEIIGDTIGISWSEFKAIWTCTIVASGNSWIDGAIVEWFCEGERFGGILQNER